MFQLSIVANGLFTIAYRVPLFKTLLTRRTIRDKLRDTKKHVHITVIRTILLRHQHRMLRRRGALTGQKCLLMPEIPRQPCEWAVLSLVYPPPRGLSRLEDGVPATCVIPRGENAEFSRSAPMHQILARRPMIPAQKFPDG
jgi:hypothetical protein